MGYMSVLPLSTKSALATIRNSIKEFEYMKTTDKSPNLHVCELGVLHNHDMRLCAPTSGSLRRRAHERQLAEHTRSEGERIARVRREHNAREKLVSQRKAREELASYEPWGRAGGGAPNARGIRFTNLRDRGIFPEDELKGVSVHEACERWAASQQQCLRMRHRQRGPVRLHEDPQLCYAENLRQSVDNDIRYRQTPDEHRHYKEILDNLVAMKRRAKTDEKKERLEYELKLQAMSGPWGKPGPGGTIWRNPRNIGLNFSNSMGWTDNDAFSKLRGDQRRSKRSSLTLPKVKRDDDVNDESTEKENVKPSSIDKLPDITSSVESPPETRKTSKDKNAKKETNSGNGNAVGKIKRSPKKCKFVKRLSNGDKVKKVIPDDRFENVYNEDSANVLEKKTTPEAAILRVTGGVELVPLLARRRRVGARTLPSSDVTRPPDQSCQWRDKLNMEYLRELKNQMRVKCMQKEEKRLNSAESVRLHHETWESLWGRQGHGAPLRGKYARNNLAQLLYVAPLTNAQ